jgi:hypothetical protein
VTHAAGAPVAGVRWSINVTLADGTLPAGVSPFDPSQVSVIIQALESSPPARNMDAAPQRNMDAAPQEAAVSRCVWFQDFARSMTAQGEEALTPRGAPVFAGHYTARTAGVQVTITVNVTLGNGVSWPISLGTFTTANSQPSQQSPPPPPPPMGFARVSAGKTYFELSAPEAGATYFPVGENVAWANNIGQPAGRGTFSFDRWFSRLAANNATYARIWLGGMFDSFNLETAATGVGTYDLRAAWRVAYVLRIAERFKIRLLVSFLSFNGLRSAPPFDLWASNAYNGVANKAGGGMLAKPAEWFTDRAAMRAFSNRVAYVAGLVGASPAVFAFEWFNEVDLVDEYASAPVLAWHTEMTEFLLTELGPVYGAGRPVTTSFSNSAGDPVVDGAAFMSYTQTHTYGAADMAADVAMWCDKKRAAYDRPTIVAEYGLDDKQPFKFDRRGLELQNGLWAAVSSTTCGGTPMIWWWDVVVDPLDWYPLFAGPARAVAGVDLASGSWVAAGTADTTGLPPNHRVTARLPERDVHGARGVLVVQNLNTTWSAEGLHNATVAETAAFGLGLPAWCPSGATAITFVFVDPPSGDPHGDPFTTTDVCTGGVGGISVQVPAFTGSLAAWVFFDI